MNRFVRFIILVVVFFSSRHTIASEGVLSWWDLDQVEDGRVLDKAGRIQDALEGSFTPVAGVRGSAVRFDGYTTCIIRKASDAPKLGKHFTMEAWIAQGAYPWNLCPIVSQSTDQKKGYYFAVGPRGEVTLQAMINGTWHVCTSESFVLSLWKWNHIAAKYDADIGLTVYVNGKPAKAIDVTGQIDYAIETELRIGCNHQAMKPSHIHREHGTLPGWFSLDGIIDEIKIHDRALKDEQVSKLFNDSKLSAKPNLPARVLPSGPSGPGRFGAYYTKLEYYPEWDNLWAVDSDPDVLVRFDDSAARVVFWRGSRYSPAWVSENGLWMADQSVEAWGVGKEDKEGCFEHMQDRRCRYSHVRIIENNPARVVVHWRYAPVSSHDHLWREDPKTGRACWVDEYYYLYPDAMGIRKPTWKTGTLKKPRQFQESLPFTHPGQLVCDVLQKDFAYVGNLKGEMQSMEYVENPKESKKQFPSDLLFQMYNFKAENKPFIVFESGDGMHNVRDFSISRYKGPGSCNHWPVGQALCDGRTAQAADRPTHFMGFPISYPPVHEKDGRSWWNGLYGMFGGPKELLVTIARSYNCPPELKIISDGFRSEGFDRAQRAYQITCEHPDKASTLEFTLEASVESPLYNLPFIVKNWIEADYQLTINGKTLTAGKEFRVGYRHLVDGTNVIVWIKLKSSEPINIKLSGR
jgi:hypothetical protein